MSAQTVTPVLPDNCTVFRIRDSHWIWIPENASRWYDRARSGPVPRSSSALVLALAATVVRRRARASRSGARRSAPAARSLASSRPFEERAARDRAAPRRVRGVEPGSRAALERLRVSRARLQVLLGSLEAAQSRTRWLRVLPARCDDPGRSGRSRDELDPAPRRGRRRRSARRGRAAARPSRGSARGSTSAAGSSPSRSHACATASSEYRRGARGARRRRGRSRSRRAPCATPRTARRSSARSSGATASRRGCSTATEEAAMMVRGVTAGRTLRSTTRFSSTSAAARRSSCSCSNGEVAARRRASTSAAFGSPSGSSASDPPTRSELDAAAAYVRLAPPRARRVEPRSASRAR